MAPSLDDLALALTEPMSRRRALQLTAAAAVTSFFSLPAGSGRAQGCPSCPRMSDPPEYSQRCSVPRGVGCIFVCCPPQYKCCTANHGVACCREGYTCGPNQRSGDEEYATCKCEKDCGGACCKPDETCANIELGLCCKIPCGSTCCRSGEKCADPNRGVCCKEFDKACIGRSQTLCCDEDFGKCCAGTRVTQCCGFGQTCDETGACDCKPGRPVPCDNECCTRSEKCCPGITRPGFCIPSDAQCCGDTATLPGEQCCAGRFAFFPQNFRCCGISGVCPKNAECCPDGCCPEGSSCCPHGCCAAGGARVGPRQPFARVRGRRATLRALRRPSRRGVRRRGRAR